MRKQIISSFVGLLLIGMGTQASAQQEKGWQGGIALPYAQESMKQFTNQPIWGLCLDGAYQLPITGSKSSFRFGLGVNWFPGQEGNFNRASIAPRTISLTGIQVSADVVVPISTSSFSIVTGLSLNTWMKDVSGKLGYAWGELRGSDVIVHPAGTLDNNVSGTVDNLFGRYGMRLGVEYALNDRTIISVMFQQTELGTDKEFINEKFLTTYSKNASTGVITATEVTLGKNTVNPSWIQFGVRYKF